jgi:fructoselysine-6-P-deglycase FrlB-like protein
MFKRFFSKKREVEIPEEIKSQKKSQPVEEVIIEKVETEAKENEAVENKELETEETKFEPNKIDWLINDSILTFIPRELYMHYWDSATEKNLQNPSWQNQGVFFWNNNEPFERKSLPEFF